MAEGQTNIIKRKLASAKAEAALRLAEGRPGPEKAWRLALARAARDQVKLVLDVPRVTLDRMSLTEVLDIAPERGLIVVLEGPAEALGVIMLGPEVLAGLIEAQTTGLVTSGPPPDRRPTRTDAAMAAGLIDAAFAEFEKGLGGLAQEAWALGYRYASFLEDIRPLGLLLEDVPYRLLRAEVNLGRGSKAGGIFVALPAHPKSTGLDTSEDQHLADESVAFAEGFAEQVNAAPIELAAYLTRLSMPLSGILDLEIGQILPLGTTSVDRISLEGLDGRKLWEGRLGQNRGMRALRLCDQLEPASSAKPPRAAAQVTPMPVQGDLQVQQRSAAAG